MIVYAIVKYLLYSLWCYVGLRVFAVHVAPVGAAFSFGAIRWLLGLGLGLLVGAWRHCRVIFERRRLARRSGRALLCGPLPVLTS